MANSENIVFKAFVVKIILVREKFLQKVLQAKKISFENTSEAKVKFYSESYFNIFEWSTVTLS